MGFFFNSRCGCVKLPFKQFALFELRISIRTTFTGALKNIIFWKNRCVDICYQKVFKYTLNKTNSWIEDEVQAISAQIFGEKVESINKTWTKKSTEGKKKEKEGERTRSRSTSRGDAAMTLPVRRATKRWRTDGQPARAVTTVRFNSMTLPPRTPYSRQDPRRD